VKTRADVLRAERRAQDRRVAETLRSKSEFMNSAAHELRTPLSVITGYVSMLQDGTFGTLPESWRAPIGVIERKTRELGALVDELLLSARIESGKVPAAPEQFDVREAVRQAVERAEPRVTLEQATLTYELPSTPVRVEIDRDHLGRILDNLIDNALTFCDGRPWVKVTVADRGGAWVLVKDRGWGVPEAMTQKIFERFVHYEDPGHRPKRGTGLGLSISRELAERYGGSVDLQWTQPGKGSTFVLRLPGAPAPKKIRRGR
jgi:signal transduction histidine kinase